MPDAAADAHAGVAADATGEPEGGARARQVGRPARAPPTAPPAGAAAEPEPAAGFGAPGSLSPEYLAAIAAAQGELDESINPCVQLAACYRDLARAVCGRGETGCRAAFRLDDALTLPECLDQLQDAGERARPFVRDQAVVTIPESCVD